MTIRVSGFPWVPPLAQGLVRDLRVRWALEEAGLACGMHLLEPGEQASPAYLGWQPFGQVPSYREDGLALFESGAIVLHVAERSPVLMPAAPAARARTIAWMFAALDSVEPPIAALAEIDLFHAGEAWAAARRPGAVDAVRTRLDALAHWLHGRDWLEDHFSAGDLLMATVLRILRHTDLVDVTPVLAAYLARCEARPAFVRALAAQLADFEAHAPTREETSAIGASAVTE